MGFSSTVDTFAVHGAARYVVVGSCSETLTPAEHAQAAKIVLASQETLPCDLRNFGARARLLAMKKGDPKLPRATESELRREVEQRQEAIVAKCNPAIFELAQLWKESVVALNSLGANPPLEIRAELEAGFEKRSEEIRRK
jgi:hypothetical protein